MSLTLKRSTPWSATIALSRSLCFENSSRFVHTAPKVCVGSVGVANIQERVFFSQKILPDAQSQISFAFFSKGNVQRIGRVYFQFSKLEYTTSPTIGAIFARFVASNLQNRTSTFSRFVIIFEQKWAS